MAVVVASARMQPRTRPALVFTVVASLASALLTYRWVCSDPHNKESALAFGVYLPLVLALTAGIVAALSLGQAGRWWAGMGAALLGAVAGEFIGLPFVAIGDPWYRLVLVAAPVVFASCAAVVAAGFGTSRA